MLNEVKIVIFFENNIIICYNQEYYIRKIRISNNI